MKYLFLFLYVFSENIGYDNTVIKRKINLPASSCDKEIYLDLCKRFIFIFRSLKLKEQ